MVRRIAALGATGILVIMGMLSWSMQAIAPDAAPVVIHGTLLASHAAGPDCSRSVSYGLSANGENSHATITADGCNNKIRAFAYCRGGDVVGNVVQGSGTSDDSCPAGGGPISTYGWEWLWNVWTIGQETEMGGPVHTDSFTDCTKNATISLSANKENSTALVTADSCNVLIRDYVICASGQAGGIDTRVVGSESIASCPKGTGPVEIYEWQWDNGGTWTVGKAA